MGFNWIHWTPVSDSYFLGGSYLEKCGQFWKKAVFLGGYGLGEIPHGRIGVYRVKKHLEMC